ncbi:hypothetical protein CHLRE_16g668000v5 [Chlamydomonas reinhardtii]|uniref:SWIM-type domain-containing protein n=1 Tax=Chlamydomonas reinhardtii TaxID=3055 RepID=A0A2K3CUG2_CHLRE|nr:uncharacterized protein CHLRE_16g668000v5 [Chlamydomonas reinhardtii]PNW71914.1 hypothetical protein CHLRE_16g668000v5 [Chlamydomonas reinhardtii]
MSTLEGAAKPLNIARAADACFADLQNYLGQNPHADVPDDILASLHLLFGKNFAKALEVVDGGGIVCFVGEHTGRRVYKVPGRRAGDHYIVFPAHYCACQSFQYDVVGRSEAVACKHQLAARLAGVLGRTSVSRVPDYTIAHMLLEHCA